MKIGLVTVLYDDKPLEWVAEYASSLGYQMVELPAWEGNNHFDATRALVDAAYRDEVKAMLAHYGLEISAIASHHTGQMVLPPPDDTLKGWGPSDDKEEMVAYAVSRMKDYARLAANMDLPVVTGFVGSTVWGNWYIWPPANEQIYERGWDLFAERWGDILDVFKEYGIRFALEVHPTEIAYNVQTSERAVECLGGRKEFGFNFDPSHLLWQLIDPVVFIKKFGRRIYHCHAKDAELQQDVLSTSGVIPTGPWQNPDRGFRFRVPGWGMADWRRIMTALVEVGYDYVLSFEHEDPVMSREDGMEKAIAHLAPLIIKSPLKQVWW
jgi:sugar phosphate isomerase/epimerase